MQKDQLEQDIFLIGYIWIKFLFDHNSQFWFWFWFFFFFFCGTNGPFRKRLALKYFDLNQKEMEFVALSRDTTESDLKQVQFQLSTFNFLKKV